VIGNLIAHGIELRSRIHPVSGRVWGGSIRFGDLGFVDDDDITGDKPAITMAGTFGTRYEVAEAPGKSALAAVVATLIADATTLGITFRRHGEHQPILYMIADGGDLNFPPPPDWRELLREQAAGIGWEVY
jgi:hypothetical protein